MGFTRFEDNVSVHQGLSDEPNIDDGLSAEQLKKKFDEPSEKLKKAFNDLISELESNNSASNVGASMLDNNDTSAANIQAKLENIQAQLTIIKNTNIDTNKINDNAVTTAKISNENVTTDKIANDAITTEKISNGSVTSDKIDADVKKASNISATIINSQDTSEANVQAKLNKIYADLIAMTQGAVADNSITSAKLADNSVTNTKIPNNSIAENKIANGLGLVPTGLICMWSGSSVPTGWYLCDGQNGTPDLRNRFIVGAGSSYSIGNTGGEASHTLTVNEIPSHNHGYSKINTANKDDNTGANMISTYNVYAASSGTTGNTGGGQAHENRPPYYALAFIMKA